MAARERGTTCKYMAKSKPRKTILYALIIVVIIADITFAFLIFQPLFTHIFPTCGVIRPLRILTQYDTTIQDHLEPAFLKLSQAEGQDSIELEWITTESFSSAIISLYEPDIILGGESWFYDILQTQGFLQKLNSTRMQTVLATINDTIGGATMKGLDGDGDVVWVAATIYSYGFAIDKGWLSVRDLQFPTHWENLSSPEMGKFLPSGSPISIGDSYFIHSRIYEIILQKFGWEKGWEILTRIIGNAKISERINWPYETDPGIYLSNSVNGFKSMLANPDMEYRIPVNGSIIIGHPIAICKTAYNQDAAEAFIDFILSNEGQSQWANLDINFLPVLESALDTYTGIRCDTLHSLYNQSKQATSIDFNYSRVLAYENSIKYYFESVLIDAYSDLLCCWAKLINAYLSMSINKTEFDSFAAQLGSQINWSSTIFTEEYAKSINSRIETDASFRSLLHTNWITSAIMKYNDLEGQIP
jgi:ABC-type Fe3+ transport system substrate-binding protein